MYSPAEREIEAASRREYSKTVYPSLVILYSSFSGLEHVSATIVTPEA
jgi:hypothetical protein